MSTTYDIYSKPWTDHSTGEWLVTLTGHSSNFLQAAIPTFISIVAPYFWIIIKRNWCHFSYRRSLATNEPYVFFRRQKQVFLQNSAADLLTPWSGIKMWWSWKKVHLPHAFRRTLPIPVVSFLFFVAWTAAGILAGKIWSSNGNGLVKPSTCGHLIFKDDSDRVLFLRQGSSSTIAAEVYVRQCYNSSTPGSSQCQTLPNQTISYQTNDATCPFASPSLCNFTNAVPIELDTNDIDSQAGFGVNAPLHDRFTYRKRTTCSPIHSGDFAEVVNANETADASLWPNDTQLYRYNFGSILDGVNPEGWTFEYSSWAPSDGGIYDLA
jgi:hypothetical protein